MLSDGEIYFGVGNFKDVYKQMEVNPNIEIVAWNGEKFLRYYGKANLDYNPEIVDKAFELMPEIAEVYKANGWEMGTFYIENATAEIRNMMEIEETYTFE